MRTTAALLAAATLVALPAAASAAPILFAADRDARTEQLGDFTGTLDYAPVTANTGSLVVTLTNTLPAETEGRITGFVFGLASADPFASVSLLSGTHPLADAPNQNAAPFSGPFAGGAALGGNFLGGGKPTPGIAPGQTGSFVFSVLAVDAQTLTSEDFLSELSSRLVVRFRGFANGGSDKVPAVMTSTPPTIPAPGAACVLGAAALLTPRRRRR